MVTCEVCGGEEFEKHAGFMYCAVCQTQSQDYHEQEYEYHDQEMNTSRKQKSQNPVKKQKKEKVYDDGFWTTWEGFNYILHGMTEELKKCGETDDFVEVVLKLWAAYLRESQVAFLSKSEEKIPKLKFRFKQRDARILYDVDLESNSKKRKITSRSSSKVSVTSDTSQSKRSLNLQRGKVIAVDYQDHLSSSMQSNSNLADETLESLGKSSELETSTEEDSGDDTESLLNSFRHMFTKKDFRVYKNSSQSKSQRISIKEKVVNDVRFPGKNRLLSIIHLALLLTGSQIQLSDLLRFIRESHLSFAKVTHFFPNNMKFPRGDLSYIEVISDALMPTHLRQRNLTGKLAHFLKLDRIPAPDMNMLVDRYCQDLNLPEQIAQLSKKIVSCFPSSTIPRSKTLFPSYEAWAMVSIIFIMKLLFGLNDRTEIFLSLLAQQLNCGRENSHSLFVFNDWQKYIECRKTVLTNFHYPTQEQLGDSSLRSSAMFLDVLMKESKDEYRKDRFVPYPRYYIKEKLLNGIKEMLNSLSKPQNVVSFEFEPSLTPQISHLDVIMRSLPVLKNFENPSSFPVDILKQSFKNCDVNFAFDPKFYLRKLDDNSDIMKFMDTSETLENKIGDEDFLFECQSRYWTFNYPNPESGHLSNFKEEILDEIPQNFQWLITECSRMLEMNIRDVYDELLRLEKKLCLGMDVLI